MTQTREKFDEKKVQHGDLVKDRVTGFEGIAIAVTRWITGCDRWVIQPQKLKDGKQVESVSIDESMLVIVKKQVVTGENSPIPKNSNESQDHKPPGGPRPEPKRTGY